MVDGKYVRISNSLIGYRVFPFILSVLLAILGILLRMFFHNSISLYSFVPGAIIVFFYGVFWEIFIGRRLCDVKANEKEIFFLRKKEKQIVKHDQVEEIDPEGLFSVRRLFLSRPFVTVYYNLGNDEKGKFVFYGLSVELVNEILLKPHRKKEMENAQASLKKRGARM